MRILNIAIILIIALSCFSSVFADPVEDLARGTFRTTYNYATGKIDFYRMYNGSDFCLIDGSNCALGGGANSSVSGSGSANQLTFWNGPASLTGNANFTLAGTTLRILTTVNASRLLVNNVEVCLANGTNCIAVANGTNGVDGINGTNGAQGAPGTNGLNGTGISSIYTLSNGSLQINLTNGTNITSGNLTGPKGDTGSQGIQGDVGPQGNPGATGPHGTNGTNASVTSGNAYINITGGVVSLNITATDERYSQLTLATIVANIANWSADKPSYVPWSSVGGAVGANLTLALINANIGNYSANAANYVSLATVVSSIQNATICHTDGTNCPVVSGDNASWNQSGATLLFYPRDSNPQGFYNVTTLPAYPVADNASWNQSGYWINASASFYPRDVNPNSYYNVSTLPTYPTPDNTSWNQSLANVLYVRNASIPTCGGTDKLTSAGNGVFTCATDQTGGGGSVNGTDAWFNVLRINKSTDALVYWNSSGFTWSAGNQLSGANWRLLDPDGTALADFNKNSDSATFLNLFSTSSYSGAVALTATGASGQTTDIVQVKNSSGSVHVRVNGSGVLNASQGLCLGSDTCRTTWPTSSGTGSGWLNTTTQVHLSNNATNVTIGRNTNALPNLFIDNTNNYVGINTRTPTTDFEVNGSSLIKGVLTVYSGEADAVAMAVGGAKTTYAALQFVSAQNATRDFIFSSVNGTQTNRMAFRVSGNEAGSNSGGDLSVLRFDDSGTFVETMMKFDRSDGYVGIGDSTPDAKLDVVGDVIIDGNLTLDGFLVKKSWTNWTNVDQGVFGTTLANITNLGWGAAANTNYTFDCTIFYRSNLTTNGISFALEDWEGTVNRFRMSVEVDGVSATTENSLTVNVTATKVSSTAVTAANTVYRASLNGLVINGASAVTITPQFSAEIAGSNSTIVRDSYCNVRVI